ncbi:hypothetical protein MIND_00881000 [Mycena indigotica]|uniref:Uncharacterized protein n=1 Tax=Mycena indigotica TaxID=2126181 RepID=A0A8H6SK56_9AGAR|nr:uncharacterized protein MIND_00881000 [Mycena indigotica]KAF7299320.1 hypothetical protein MIND_00881000 [Mycena indigotica]
MLDLPRPEDAPGPRAPRFNQGDFRRPTWISPHHPFLLFLPRDDPFKTKLLSCLNVTPRTLSIENHVPYGYLTLPENPLPKDRWGLEQKLIDQWVALEGSLHKIYKALVLMYDPEGIVHPGVWGFNLPVTQYYTLRSALTRNDAVRQAMRARDTFLPLVAMIAMLYVLMDDKETGDWRFALQRKTQVPWQFFDDLERELCNPQVERLGGIIDLTASKTYPNHYVPRHIRWLLPHILKNHRVPLYFFFGKTFPPNEPIPDPLKELGLIPNYEEIEYLENLPGSSAFSPWSTKTPVWTSGRTVPRNQELQPRTLPTLRDPRPPLFERRPPKSCYRPYLDESPDPGTTDDRNEHADSVGAATIVYPPVEPHSGQLPGEKIHEFMARRKKNNEKRLARESESKRKTRLKLEEIAKTGEPPSIHGKHGTKVYIWETSGIGGDSFILRRHYGQKDARDRWDEFAPTQRIYDGFSNEWDLAEELDPEAEVPDDGFDMNDEFDHEYPAIPHVDSVVPEQSAVEVLEQVYANDDKMQVDVAVYVLPNNDDIAIKRYGLQTGFVAPRNAKQMKAVWASWACGDTAWKNDIPINYSILLQAMFDIFDTTRTIQPVGLCDINTMTASLHSEAWPVAVKKIVVRGRLRFLFVPDDDSEEEPMVLVEDGATVLQCIRSGWKDTKTIIEELAIIGADFSPCWIRNSGKTLKPALTQDCLGRRPPGYRLNTIDYQAYVKRRDDFLKSQRGWAALFHGGIVSRIARMTIGDYLHNIHASPPGTTLYQGAFLADIGEGRALWREALTASEIDLILGVYKVETGVSAWNDEMGAQIKYASIWPSLVAFHSSGLNVGYWSANCERWFQRRLAELQQGDVEILNTPGWKDKIRFNSQARKTATSNSEMCRRFLASCPAVGYL